MNCYSNQMPNLILFVEEKKLIFINISITHTLSAYLLNAY
jgi:hypothetical protein